MSEYRVGIRKLSDRPVVGPGGELTHEVVYSIASEHGALSVDWDGGVVQGDTLARCLQLQEMGDITVPEPSDWGEHKPDQWQEVVVNLALDHSKSESA